MKKIDSLYAELLLALLLAIKNFFMKTRETSPHKLDNVIRVIQYESESQKDALWLAGYPEHEENRFVIFRVIVKPPSREKSKL